jgi:hypothetical protein
LGTTKTWPCGENRVKNFVLRHDAKTKIDFPDLVDRANVQEGKGVLILIDFRALERSAVRNMKRQGRTGLGEIGAPWDLTSDDFSKESASHG